MFRVYATPLGFFAVCLKTGLGILISDCERETLTHVTFSLYTPAWPIGTGSHRPGRLSVSNKRNVNVGYVTVSIATTHSQGLVRRTWKQEKSNKKEKQRKMVDMVRLSYGEMLV